MQLPCLSPSFYSNHYTVDLVIFVSVFLSSLLISVFLLPLLCFHRRSSAHGGRRLLPPGSMGWPYIGETLKLYTENPNSFFATRQARYGDIFKTHILGCPCVMVSSPESARVVLETKAHLFKPTYPPSKEKMIGPEALFFHQGAYHYFLKKAVQSSFTPFAIRDSVAEIEKTVLKLLRNWDDKKAINTLKEMKRYAFDVAIMSVFGSKHEENLEVEGIKRLYQQLEKGYNSMPLDLPGTAFYRAMKARKQLNETLKALIQKRKETRIQGGGLLGVLLEAKDKRENQLSDSQIADNIIGVLFAAHDTTASVLTWLLKYLQDNQDMLEAVTNEQAAIGRKVREENRRLTWEDTRSMKFTTRVIQETLRTASILSFTFREAVEDVEFGGYIIPKGWKVLPLFRSIHHSPDFFPDPGKFDPSRFEVSPRPNTYMPFGKGVHACPGSELAKLEMLLLLHHLTTTFRFVVKYQCHVHIPKCQVRSKVNAGLLWVLDLALRVLPSPRTRVVLFSVSLGLLIISCHHPCQMSPLEDFTSWIALDSSRYTTPHGGKWWEMEMGYSMVRFPSPKEVCP